MKRTTQQQQQQQQEKQQQDAIDDAPIPETIILECNRFTSRQDDALADAYNTNHRWTTEFANGIEIRKGDEIKINSGYISSIGVGDLIEWDNLEGSPTQDNKANWLYSFYTCNDALNDKREGYNMKIQNGEGGTGNFPFDVDNSACNLMRTIPTVTIGNPTTLSDGYLGSISSPRYSYYQDPYLPCRILGETFPITSQIIDNHFRFTLFPDTSFDAGTDNLSVATSIRMDRMHSAGASDNYQYEDPRRYFSIGQTLYFKAQPETYLTANPNEFYHNGNQNWVFTVSDIRKRTAPVSGEGDEYELIVDYLGADTGITNPLSSTPADLTILSAKVYISSLPYRTNQVETGQPTDYQHTAISTFLNPLDKENYTEIGDIYKQYTFEGAKVTTPTAETSNVIELNDSQTGNTSLDCEIVYTDRTADNMKIPITIWSLYNTTVGLPANTAQQQIIFELSSSLNITTAQGLIDFVGTNFFLLDLYNPYNGDKNFREIASCFINDGTINPNTVNNLTYDSGNNRFTLKGIKRVVNNSQYDVLQNGQVITANIDITNGSKNYIIKSSLFFTGDVKATLIEKGFKQDRGVTGDWNTEFISKTVPITTPYFIYVKNNNQDLSTITLFNNRSFFDGDYSNTFNFRDAENNRINPVLLYAGYEEEDTLTTIKKHYQEHELIITENYSSPANIATEITRQTHEVTNARDKDGNIIPNSKKQGIIQNSYYIPVWSSAEDDNLEDTSTGELQGTILANSFHLEYNLYYSSSAYYNPNIYCPNGSYKIYFRTRHTSINKPVAFITPQPTAGNAGTGGQPALPNKPRYTQDFRNTYFENIVDNTLNNVEISQSDIPANTPFNLKPIQFASARVDEGNIEIGFPLEYYPNALISQYSGSNNVTLIWDDTNSRFALNYLHQPTTSKFEVDETGVGQGGEISSIVYFPTPKGQLNADTTNTKYAYKLPQTRLGGINIENWNSKKYTLGMTPTDIRNLAGLPKTTDLSTNWFVTDHHNISPDTPELQKNYDPVGNRFWNKLGFNNTQLFKTFVGSETDAITGRYLPKGTTDNLADISDALIGSNEPAENTPLFTTVATFGKSTTASQAGYDFSSWGAMNFNNHATGYGLPNTAGQPNQFEGNSPDDLDNGVVNFSEYESTYNPDRERNTSYIFTSIGEPIVAEGLPTKTEFPYFLCMSDLIDTNFNISKNHGSGLNCMGLISKANAEQDFYFQYQAPQSFYASKDTTITSITTELRTPNLGIPPALSPYSSVIYQITRYAPRPVKTSMPVWLEQNMAFSQIKDILQQISTSLNTQPLISSDNVNNYVDAPIDVGASLNNIIPDMEADQVEVYTEWIKDNRSLVKRGAFESGDGGIYNLSQLRPDVSLSKLLGDVVNLSNNDGDNFSNDNFNSDNISEATVVNQPLPAIPIKKDEDVSDSGIASTVRSVSTVDGLALTLAGINLHSHGNPPPSFHSHGTDTPSYHTHDEDDEEL